MGPSKIITALESLTQSGADNDCTAHEAHRQAAPARHSATLRRGEDNLQAELDQDEYIQRIETMRRDLEKGNRIAKADQELTEATLVAAERRDQEQATNAARKPVSRYPAGTALIEPETP